MQILIPKSVVENSAFQDMKKSRKDSLVQAVNVLLTHTRKNDYRYETSVPSKLIQDYAGKSFSQTTALCEMQVLQLSRNYYAGSHSKKFKWVDGLAGVPATYELQTVPAKNRQNKWNQDHVKLEQSKLSDTAQKQAEVIQSGRVRLDDERIDQILRESSDNKGSILQYRHASEFLTKQFWLKQEIIAIKDKDRFGRLHTPVTNLSKKLRKALLLDNQQVVEVDISCCNPCILAWLAQNNTEPSSDLDEYAKLCASGKLYKAMADQARVSVETAKTQFQVMINSTSGSSNKTAKAFRKSFPAVAQFFNKLRKLRNEGDKGGLQKRNGLVEAEICLEAARRLIDTGVPTVTVHDCLVVPTIHGQKAKSVLEIRCEEVIGFMPKIKLS